VHNFVQTDGAHPSAALLLAANGNFYGTTSAYSDAYCGTVFEIPAGGEVASLVKLCDEQSVSGLVQDYLDGNFYGTIGPCSILEFEGCNFSGNSGSVFRVTPTGSVTLLHTFCKLKGCVDGGAPTLNLVQAANGFLYGTTSGGSNGDGTVFSIGTGGCTK
jgi:uncharacterized repeat protein (TIGR03803 family)